MVVTIRLMTFTAVTFTAAAHIKVAYIKAPHTAVIDTELVLIKARLLVRVHAPTCSRA
jgi:hypothetical protein